MLSRLNILHSALGISHWAFCIALAVIVVVGAARPASAQDPPPRIGPFVVDVRGDVAMFGDDPALAASRVLLQSQMPGFGFGLSAGAHVYFPKVIGIVFGIGGEWFAARSHRDAPEIIPVSPLAFRPVTETFRTLSPQISMNFGNGNGWSYLSAGLGQSTWSILPDGVPPRPLDEESQRTINYGGGGRWFFKRHLAFSLDVRLYQIDIGQAFQGFPGSPRTLLLVIGAGMAVK